MKLNGTPSIGDPGTELDPASDVARTLYEASMEPGDPPWDAVDAEERESLRSFAEEHIAAYVTWLAVRDFRTIPSGAVPRPRTEDEALAMIKAAKDWFDAQKRKSSLVGSVAPKKLILPPGVH